MASLRFLAQFLLLLAFVSTCLLHVDGEGSVKASEEESMPPLEEEGESSDEVKEEDDVLVLNARNFDRVVNENDITLVEFYAPWCGHCKSLAPEYAKAAKQMKKADHPVAFAKVDATVEADIAQRYDISGYPTLKIFRKGTAYDYDGPRQEEGIVKYMTEQSDPDWKPPPVSMLTLTKDNFTEVINRENLMLVEFFAPWCGHCKQIAPELEKAAQELKEHDPPILIAAVDATVETDLAQKYKVQGYPTMKVFRKGKEFEYKGGRDQHGISSYMRSQVGPSSRLFDSLKRVQNFMKEKEKMNEFTIVGFFDGEDDKLLEKYLDGNNDVRDDYPFAHTFDPAAKKYFGIKESSIVLYQPEIFQSKYEPKKFVYKGDYSPASLQAFYKEKRVPLVGLFSSFEKDKKYAARPLCLVFYDVKFNHEYRTMTQFWRAKVVEVANDNRDITFAVADEDENADEIKEFELVDSGEEVNVGCFDKDGKKYRLDPEEEFSEDRLRDFVDDFKAGNLQAIVKSQPVPKSNDGPVKIVVGKTFEDIVFDTKKDVLIELYAPWCGHCKSLEPTYKKLGKHFKKNKNIVVAKMDATTNDLPSGFSAEGFPTIYFVTAKDKKNPIKFEGDRQLKDFIKFIEEKATVSLAKDEL